MNRNLTTDTIFWSDELEVRLRELYVRDDIADIFWGQRVEENSTSWQIYAVTRLFCPYTKSEAIGDQTIHFIEEVAGFSKAERVPQSSHDPLHIWNMIPQDLEMAFDEALENELGQSFRDAHYNLVGMSTGYKRTGGKFTAIPAIILYVRQKGILRRGCDGLFPREIRGFPVDVVEACIATPCCDHGVELCQRYQTDVKLGSSIGVGLTGSKKTNGTLGAVVYEQNPPNRIGILSCEHVLKFSQYSTVNECIHQPSREDLLENLKRKLNDLIDKSNEPGAVKEDFEVEIYCQQQLIDRAKKKDSTLAVYEKGMRENFLSDIYNQHYGIDAAFGIFSNENRLLHASEFAVTSSYFDKAGLFDAKCLKGVYTHENLRKFDRASTKIFKLGRTTGLTIGNWIPTDTTIAIDLKDEIIDQDIFIKYLKSPVYEEIRKYRQLCYPSKWLDRQMAFQFKPEEFKSGDSGASVVDENGMALGLLHAKWQTEIYTCGIASPYFAIFEALKVDICLNHNTIRPGSYFN